MVEVSSAPTALGTLVRVSVVAGDRRLDVGAPGSIPVAELVPGFARTLRLLDSGSVYGGYHLVRADGTVLDTSVSLIAQSVSDGAVLTLEAGATRPARRVYDDVVEAVADAVEKDYAPWTEADSARTAVGAASAFLLAGAVLLLGGERGDLLSPVVATVVGALVLISAAVIGRRENHSTGAQAMVLCGAAFWMVAGFGFISDPGPAGAWGWPLAATGSGALLAGLAGLVILAERQEICVVPVTIGLVLGGAGAAIALTDVAPGQALALTVALAVTASNGIPWLALSSTSLRAVSPQSDAEIAATPPPVDETDVRRDYRRGYRMQFGLRGAVSLVALLVTPAVVGLGLSGTILMVLCYTGMLLSVRQTFSRADVLIVMATGILGLTFTTLTAAVLHPEWRGSLLVSVALVAAVVVGACLIAPRPRAAFGRVADSVEILSLALLLPLGVTAAGLL